MSDIDSASLLSIRETRGALREAAQMQRAEERVAQDPAGLCIERRLDSARLVVELRDEAGRQAGDLPAALVGKLLARRRSSVRPCGAGQPTSTRFAVAVGSPIARARSATYCTRFQDARGARDKKLKAVYKSSATSYLSPANQWRAMAIGSRQWPEWTCPPSIARMELAIATILLSFAFCTLTCFTESVGSAGDYKTWARQMAKSQMTRN